MADLFSTLGAWSWVAVGLVLIGLELAVPGTYLLWFGLAAIATAGVAAIVDVPLIGQGVVFAVLSVVAVYEGRRRLSGAEEPETLNLGAHRLIGTVHRLDRPILDGRGRMKVGDGWWGVDGPDAPEGARVIVIAIDEGRLRVEPAPPQT